MFRLNFRNLRFRAAALLLAAMAFASCHSAEAETVGGRSLVQHLRQGGYVLLMRHAHSPTAPPAKDAADPDNTNLERQLDETGRSTARAMGAAIRKLNIPIGTVLSSPTYRALETVRLAALGSPQTYLQLGDGGQSMMSDAVRSQAAWLRERVTERPNDKGNTIIVTHMPNIETTFAKEAVGLSDGEALVFHPDGHGGASLVAKVKIEDWPTLANK